MESPFLVIKLKPNSDPDGSDVGIRWNKPHPEIFTGDDDKVWDEGDQAWTKICNSIHALLGELDFKGLSWEVEFDCPDTSPIIEKDLTRNQYHDRNKKESPDE